MNRMTVYITHDEFERHWTKIRNAVFNHLHYEIVAIPTPESVAVKTREPLKASTRAEISMFIYGFTIALNNSN